jgi:MYXO-CTERM domain-containing protein
VKNQNRVAARIAAGMVAVASAAGTARAEFTPFEMWICDSTSTVGRVDVRNGAVLQTFQIPGGVDFWDIAFDPSGTMYGISSSKLYRVDTTTGAVAEVGDYGPPNFSALVFGADGTLYAAGGSTLYTINPLNAASTVIGVMGFSSAGDLAFSGSTLYMTTTTNDLVRVNASTGATELVGALGVSQVLGLATSNNGITYAMAGTTIYSVDLSSGALTAVSTYSSSTLGTAWGGAFVCEATPAPGALALLALGGIACVRRRR